MKQLTSKENIVFFIPLVLAIIGLVLYPMLPEQIPMQFSFSGETSWSLPKVLGVWTMPILEVIIIALQRVSKKKNPLVPILILISLIQIAIWCFCLL